MAASYSVATQVFDDGVPVRVRIHALFDARFRRVLINTLPDSGEKEVCHLMTEWLTAKRHFT